MRFVYADLEFTRVYSRYLNSFSHCMAEEGLVSFWRQLVYTAISTYLLCCKYEGSKAYQAGGSMPPINTVLSKRFPLQGPAGEYAMLITIHPDPR